MSRPAARAGTGASKRVGRSREVVASAGGGAPWLADAVLELVAARFRILGDPSRLRLLGLLMQGEHTVQELVDASGLTQTNVSRHLGLLRRDGIVGRQRDGNRAVYRITDPTVEKLCALVCGELTQRRSADLDALQAGEGI
jgi:ArsR family transcriptional regulator